MESSFPDELWAKIRKDFGDHFVRHKQYKASISNYENSLSLYPDDLNCVHHLTKVEILEGKVNKALEDLKEYSKSSKYRDHFKCNFQECNCHYEQNEFEKSMLCVNDKKLIFQGTTVDTPHCGPEVLKKIDEAKYKGPKLSQLQKHFDMICINYEDMLGKNAGNCLYDHKKYFDKILHKWKPPKEHRKRDPIVLMGNDPCEFLRNKVEIVIPKTVKEIYRNEQVQRFFAQSYMYSAWKDFVFLNELKTHKDLEESTQNAESFKNIHNAIDECIDKNSKIISQLHARCPLYTKKHKIKSEERNKTIKFRMQYKIRREMFNALEEIQKCHWEKNLEKLIQIAEHELGVRYRIHPSSLMPRKNEFTVEICNYIALAHIEDIIKSTTSPQNSIDDTNYDKLKKLLRIYWRSKMTAVPYIFGDQTTYRDPAEPDRSFLEFRKNIVRLEQRMSQKPMLKIEKCHLLHEMGRANLKQKRPDDAREFGEQIVVAAQGVSYLWIFLGYLMICRADVIQKQFNDALTSMDEALGIVDMFKSDELKSVLVDAYEIIQELAEA